MERALPIGPGMRKVGLGILGVLGILLVFGFVMVQTARDGPGRSSTGTVALNGTEWAALLVDNVRPDFNAQPSLSFVDEAKVRGNAGCNPIHGTVWISGSSIVFFNLEQHLMACEGKSDHRQFLPALHETRSFALEAEKLVFRDAAGKVRVIMMRVETPRPSPAPRSTPSVPGLANFQVLPSPTSSSPALNIWLEQLAAAQFAPVTPKLGEYFGTSTGVLVVTIPERNVFKLQDGDVILSVRGKEPVTPTNVRRILAPHSPGETMELQLMRQKRKQVYAVTLP